MGGSSSLQSWPVNDFEKALREGKIATDSFSPLSMILEEERT